MSIGNEGALRTIVRLSAVLDGVLSIFTGGEWHDLSAGAFAVLPKGIPHAQGNTSSSPVRFLGSGSPAGFERLFPELDELAKRVPAGTPEFGKDAARLLSQHATTVVGRLLAGIRGT